ncbi:MAG: ABC transporter ATP-binding protein [Candidatus Kapabacteria bacterium]|nr:ABC transporter ATP-binding protein [Candidatus Kapabacteria bacterium]
MHHDHSARPILFDVQHVTKSYRMGELDVVALNDVSLSIRQSELLVILGASGSGKSTLLNILGGLDVPTSGTVHYRQQDLTNAGDAELTEFRRRSVGFVFQFYNIIPSLTALENVKLVTDLVDAPMDPRQALELVGLADRMGHFPSQMSGGEQQRVAIARAIAKRPDVLLCDEPTGALDFETGVKVLEVIDMVHRELDATVALITHNASIADMADRVLRMRSGSIVEEYSPPVRKQPRELSW